MRQVYEEEIVVQLREISAKLDAMQENLRIHDEKMETQLKAILAEQEIYRLNA